MTIDVSWSSFPERRPSRGIHVRVETTKFEQFTAFRSARDGGCFVDVDTRRTFPEWNVRYWKHLT